MTTKYTFKPSFKLAMSNNYAVPATQAIVPADTSKEVLAMSQTVLNRAWIDQVVTESLEKSRARVLNPVAAFHIVEAVLEAAPISDLTKEIVGLDKSWKALKQIPLGCFSRIVTAALVGGVLPKWFEDALDAGQIALIGKGVLPQNYPAAILPKLVRFEDYVPGSLHGMKAIMFTSGVGFETRKAWYTEADDLGVPEISTARELMDDLYSNTEFSLQHFSSLVRLHAPKTDAAGVFQVQKGYEVLGIKVLKDEEKDGMFRFIFNGEELKRNTFSAGKIDGVYDHNINPFRTAFLALAHILAGNKGRKNMSGRIAFLTEAFLEKAGGAHRSDRMETISNGKAGVVHFAPSKNFGFFVRNGEGEQRLQAQRAFAELGLATFGHHQFDWFTVGIGAEAKGVGVMKDGDAVIMRTFMKPDKLTKLLNRMSLAKPTAKIRAIARAMFGLQLSNGKTVALEGMELSIMYGNSAILSNGSGNNICRKDFSVTVTGTKTYHVEITLGSDTDEAEAERIAKLKTKTGRMLQIAESGKTGSGIVTWNGSVRQAFDQFNSEFTVINKQTHWDSVKKVLVVDVTVEWEYTTCSEKFVLDGHKFRTTPDTLLLQVHEGGVSMEIPQPDVFIDGEGLKGPQGLVCWWAEHVGGIIYDPKQGLTPFAQQMFASWCEANTVQMFIRRRVNSILYSNLKLKYGQDPAYVFHGNNWVTWTGDVITGKVVAAVEYSTTYQAVGRSSLFPELLYSLSLLYKPMGDFLWDNKKAAHNRGALQGLIKMALNTDPKPGVTPVVELSEDEPILEFVESTKGSEILDAFIAEFPRGCILKWHDAEQFVDGDALKQLGFQTGSGGVNGPTADLVDLIRYFAIEDEDMRPGKNPDKYITSMLNRFNAGVSGMLASKGVLNKAVRTGKLLTRKVSTVSRYGVEAWTLHVNPMDPDVLSGALRNGQIVGSCRVPMVFWGAFRVVFDVNTPIGLFEVDPYCWAAVNEGDSDGDGIAVMVFPKKAKLKNGDEIEPADAFWNACHVTQGGSRLSSSGLWLVTDNSFPTQVTRFADPYFDLKFPENEITQLTGGYAYMYGKDPLQQPFFDFLAQKPEKDPKNIAYLITRDDAGVEVSREIFNANVASVASYLDLCDDVFTHYSRFVGSSYGIATIGLYLLSLMRDQERWDDVKKLLPLLVFLQRLLHEGKHLGGCTPEVKAFWGLLEELVDVGEITTPQDKVLEGGAAVLYLLDTYLKVGELADDALKLTEEQAELLLEFRKIARAGGAAERGKDTAFGQDEIFDETVEDMGGLFRFCRLFSNGSVVRLNKNEKLHEAEAITQGYALTDQYDTAFIAQIAGKGSLLGKVAKSAFAAHSGVVEVMRELYGEDAGAQDRGGY